MKSKRAPWHTSKVGHGWHLAGQRYLQIAAGPQSWALKTFTVFSLMKQCLNAMVCESQAEMGDTLQKVFAEAILTETLEQHVILVNACMHTAGKDRCNNAKEWSGQI